MPRKKPINNSPKVRAAARLVDVLGGPAQAARLLGVAIQSACFWREGRRTFPPRLAPRAERLSEEAGRRVAAEELCPEVEWAAIRSRPAFTRSMN